MTKPVNLPPKAESTNQDLKLAKEVEGKYADLDGLTHLDCIELGSQIPPEQCDVLQEMLQDGIITEAERQEALAKAEFSKDPIAKARFSRLIADIAGADGRRALRARVRWLGNNIDDVEKTDKICEALHTLPSDPTAVPYLAAALGNPNEKVRCNAAKLLGDQGPGAEANVTDLLMKKLKDTNETPKVRLSVLSAVGNIGLNNKKDVSELISILFHDDFEIAHGALNALAKIAPDEKGPASAIIKYLNQTIKGRGPATAEEAKLKGLDMEAVGSYLRKCLKHEDSDVRMRTSYLVGKMGTNIKLSAAKFADNVVKVYTEKGVIDFFGLESDQECLSLDPGDVLDVLKDGILDPEEHERLGRQAEIIKDDAPVWASWLKEAADKLAGSDGKRLLHARINKLYNDGGQEKISEFFRGSYYKTNGTHGLLDLLKNEKDPRIHSGALDALVKIAPKETDAALAIIEEVNLKIPDECTDKAKKEILAGLDVEAVVSYFGECLKHDDGDVRTHAAFALGKMGPAAMGAKDDLNTVALGDTREDVRLKAVWALNEIAAAQAAKLDLQKTMYEALYDSSEKVNEVADGALREIQKELEKAVRDDAPEVPAKVDK
jgi:HEAT repeat protein